MVRTILVALWLSVTLSPASSAATTHTVSFSSGPTKVNLLELYTSEGCSSCPAADRWLSDLQESPGLWRRIIPLAFHVDYWNYLGWKDMFAKPDYGKRQYRYQRTGNIKAVYTPGFVVNGKEWRSWFSRGALPDTHEQAGELQVTLDDRTIKARYLRPDLTGQPLKLNIALLGFDLKSEIKAGENRGKALTHDFVVLAHQQQVSGAGNWQLSLAEPHQPSSRMALAAWVTKVDNQAPLQATGGWLH